MAKVEDFAGKRVTVLGLRRSGLSAALLLKDRGADVFVSELGDSPQLRQNSQILAARGIDFEIGRHSQERIERSDIVVISPGINNDSPAVKWTDASGIPVISEIELGFLLCPAKVIAVTGTNGKTTVTTLIGEVISAAGQRVFTCGNIGRPFCSDVARMKKEDFVALEVSSFQLERTQSFKPYVAVILNIAYDHMDRYGCMEEYFQAKKKIFANQDNTDFLILNYDDPLLANLAGEAKSHVLFFRQEEGLEGEFRLNPNHFAVLTVAGVLGIPRDTCIEVFKRFRGGEHRLETVRLINGVLFINDSKSTNIDSAIWALRNLTRPAILIAGGRDKKGDLRSISKLIEQKVKHMVLIGEARQRFYDFFKGIVSLDEAYNFEDAVRIAYGKALPGDCVILSPMCASFDMFDDYEHRGRVFKEIVNRL